MVPQSKAKRIGRATALALAIAAPAEGLRQIAYYDQVGIITICYGHTGSDVVPGKKLSIEECRGLLSADMNTAINTVENCVPGLPDHVLAAFGDAVFNMGPTIACDTKNSTAARMLKAGDILGACQQLPKWNKASVGGIKIPLPGLTNRRERERVMCSEGFA